MDIILSLNSWYDLCYNYCCCSSASTLKLKPQTAYNSHDGRSDGSMAKVQIQKSSFDNVITYNLYSMSDSHTQ